MVVEGPVETLAMKIQMICIDKNRDRYFFLIKINIKSMIYIDLFSNALKARKITKLQY